MAINNIDLCENCEKNAEYIIQYRQDGALMLKKLCLNCLLAFQENFPQIEIKTFSYSRGQFTSLNMLSLLNSRHAQAEIPMAMSDNLYSHNDGFGQRIGNAQAQQSPIIEKYADNLNKMAENGELTPIIGREKEIKRIEQILCRKNKSNPVLIGEAGVGKSAIIEGLAQKIVKKQVSSKLQDKKIYSLNITNLIAGTKYRGDFEEKIQKIIDYIIDHKEIIIFIDEVHTIVGAGASDGASGDVSQILKPYLSRGKIKLIGATTLDEYRKHIEKDKALERRFSTVIIKEPTKEESVEILFGLKERYETFHNVKILDEAINSAVDMSCRYINDRYLPDKAIDLIDEACAASSLRSESKILEDFNKAIEDVKGLNDEKQMLMISKNIDELNKLEIKKSEIKQKLEKLKKELEIINGTDANSYISEIDKDSIASVINLWTGIPVVDLSKDDKKKFLNIEEEYRKLIIGQDLSVKALCNSFKMSITDIKNPKLPIGAFIFAGPSGVGKTHLAKITAKLIFNSENNMIRLDMSEYMEQHTVSKLIGSPPGYVGYDDSNRLCEPIRKNPYQVVLFDEIEKAHPDVFNLLLQLLDEGHLTDSRGRKVDFKNTIIIMTTNLGTMSSTIKTLGFVDGKDQKNSRYEKLKSSIHNSLNKHFRPEFLNRVDETIVFEPLTNDDLRQIVNLLLENIRERLENKGIEIEFTDEAKDGLINKGFNEAFGARPLRRAIKSEIETPIAIKLLEDEFTDGDTILVDYKNEFLFSKK